MKKELILAIGVGSALGLFLGFGFYKANIAVKQKAQTALEASPSGTKNHLQKTVESDYELEIFEPMNNQVFFTATATVSGQTAPNSPLVFLTEETEYTAMADKSGYFSLPIALVKGINELKIVSINNFSTQKEKNIDIIFTDQEP